MNVSDVDRQHTGYNLHGIVDVPSHPRNDDERAFLAGVLFRYAEIPDKGKRAYQLANWCAVEGGGGVKIEHCGPIAVFTEKNISNLKVFKPPEFEDLDGAELQGDNEHNTWRTEYHSNRYCRFESRKELNQRFQDIQVNTVILAPSGKMTFTKNKVWYRLSQHVIDEMLIRGQPPHERNLDPRVELAMPFKDGELCKKAGEVISARGTSHDVIVKYGNYEHMKELYERGRVWMNPVTTYESSLNQAVRDNERTFVYKGGYRPRENPSMFFY